MIHAVYLHALFVAIMIISGGFVYAAISGLVTGKMTVFTGRGSYTVLLHEKPIWYWINVIFDLGFGSAVGFFCFRLMCRRRKKEPPA